MSSASEAAAAAPKRIVVKRCARETFIVNTEFVKRWGRFGTEISLPSSTKGVSPPRWEKWLKSASYTERLSYHLSGRRRTLIDSNPTPTRRDSSVSSTRRRRTLTDPNSNPNRRHSSVSSTTSIPLENLGNFYGYCGDDISAWGSVTLHVTERYFLLAFKAKVMGKTAPMRVIRDNMNAKDWDSRDIGDILGILDDNVGKLLKQVRMIEQSIASRINNNVEKLLKEMRMIQQSIESRKKQKQLIDDDVEKLLKEMRMMEQSIESHKKQKRLIDGNVHKLLMRMRMIEQIIESCKKRKRLIDGNVEKLLKEEARRIEQRIESRKTLNGKSWCSTVKWEKVGGV